MNLDMTFCSGLRCDRKVNCERWTGNLETKARKQMIDLTGRRISTAQFADHNGNCVMFIQKDIESKERAI